MKKIILDFLIIQNLFLSLSKINVMASEWDAAALQVAGQLGATALNSYLVADANDKEREWALERYHEQLADQRENWNMVNEYNDPSNVMLRLAKAGLNPNLAITGITGASQAAQPVGKAEIPSRHPNAPQFNMDALAIGNLVSQIKLNESQAKKNIADADKAVSEKEKNIATTTGLNIDNDIKEATATALKLQPYLANELTEAEISRTQETIQLIKSEIGLNEEQTKLITEQVLEIQARIEEIKARTDLTYEQIITEGFKQVELQASAAAHRAQASVAPAMASMYGSIARLNNTDAEFKEENKMKLSMRLTNEVSKLYEDINESVQRQNMTQEEIETEKFIRKNKLFDDLINAGDIMLRVYDAKTRRLGATRSRSSTTTNFDRKGRMTSRHVTNSN